MNHEGCHFKRPPHQLIARVLAAINTDLFDMSECFFGGGTAIALAYGEYRESIDIDFVVSSKEGYRALREVAKGHQVGLGLFKEHQEELAIDRMRMDQYGIRMVVSINESALIKFEIVNEGRVEIQKPGVVSRICGVSILSRLDMATTKLLANSDRWADRAVYSRDIIDLSMLGLSKKELGQAISKAETAYGSSIMQDLKKSLTYLTETPKRLDQCMEAMSIDLPRAVLWQKLKKLERDSANCL